jgi:hypothetical protein
MPRGFGGIGQLRWRRSQPAVSAGAANRASATDALCRIITGSALARIRAHEERALPAHPDPVPVDLHFSVRNQRTRSDHRQRRGARRIRGRHEFLQSDQQRRQIFARVWDRLSLARLPLRLEPDVRARLAHHRLHSDGRVCRRASRRAPHASRAGWLRLYTPHQKLRGFRKRERRLLVQRSLGRRRPWSRIRERRTTLRGSACRQQPAGEASGVRLV